MVTAKSTPLKGGDTISLTIEIEDHNLHYTLGSFADRPSGAMRLSEWATLYLWGSIVEPDAKRDRDIQVSIGVSENLPLGGEAKPLGQLTWGASRAASVYVPLRSFWPIAHAVQSGQLRRISLTTDAPLRGAVLVRSIHMLTDEFEIARPERSKRGASG